MERLQEQITRLRIERERIRTENNCCWLLVGVIFIAVLIISVL